VEAGVPPGSPVAPILLTAYLPGVYVPGDTGTFVCGRRGVVEVGERDKEAEQCGRRNAGLGKGELRSPVQSALHGVARNLDRLQNAPQRAPLREDEGYFLGNVRN